MFLVKTAGPGRLHLEVAPECRWSMQVAGRVAGGTPASGRWPYGGWRAGGGLKNNKKGVRSAHIKACIYPPEQPPLLPSPMSLMMSLKFNPGSGDGKGKEMAQIKSSSGSKQ